MHPGHYHAFGGHHGFDGGPSRLLWFILGGVFASWWWRYKYTRHIEGNWSACKRHHMHRRGAVQDCTCRTEPDNLTRTQGRHQQEQQSQWLPADLPPPPPQEDRFRALGAQAVDNMSEISEATLDSILTTVQSLKIKLAENRLARAKGQLEQRQQQLETAQSRPSSPSLPSSPRGWDDVKNV